MQRVARFKFWGVRDNSGEFKSFWYVFQAVIKGYPDSLHNLIHYTKLNDVGEQKK